MNFNSSGHCASQHLVKSASKSTSEVRTVKCTCLCVRFTHRTQRAAFLQETDKKLSWPYITPQNKSSSVQEYCNIRTTGYCPRIASSYNTNFTQFSSNPTVPILFGVLGKWIRKHKIPLLFIYPKMIRKSVSLSKVPIT